MGVPTEPCFKGRKWGCWHLRAVAMNECGATEAEATGEESNHRQNHSSAEGRGLSRGFSLFAGVLSYKVTTNTGFVGVKPLLVGEMQGWVLQASDHVFVNLCVRMCLLYLFLFKDNLI